MTYFRCTRQVVESTVNFRIPECTCKDWARHHIPCKHFFAVFEQCPGWSWQKLSQHFQGSSYLSADTNSVQRFLHMEQTADEDLQTADEDQHSDHQCEDFPLPQLPKSKVIQW